MKKLFLDTNVILDILLRRDPFYADAARLWLKIESGELKGMVSLPSLTTIFYLVRRSSDATTARHVLQTMCKKLQIADSPRQAGHLALQSHLPDFEDALQYEIAVLAGADCLITRNPSHFPKRGKLPIWTPDEFLKKPTL